MSIISALAWGAGAFHESRGTQSWSHCFFLTRPRPISSACRKVLCTVLCHGVEFPISGSVGGLSDSNARRFWRGFAVMPARRLRPSRARFLHPLEPRGAAHNNPETHAKAIALSCLLNLEDLSNGGAKWRTQSWLPLMIDKLNFRLVRPIPLSLLVVAGAKPPVLDCLRGDRCRAYRVARGIWLVRNGQDPPEIKGVISRPSEHPTWEDYRSKLEGLLPHDALATSKVQRIDLAVDYHETFAMIIEGLDVRHIRRISPIFDGASGMLQSCRIGRAPRQLQIYDKYEEQRRKRDVAPHRFPWTRVEATLTRQAVPCQSPIGIAERYRTAPAAFLNAFHGVTVHQISFVQDDKDLPRNRLTGDRLATHSESSGRLSASSAPSGGSSPSGYRLMSTPSS